ncbi:MAG: hypothetical protein SCJ97_11345 [Bacillota bacterium]|nr:hypothetical protein [Bacillota bacterium]
MERFVKYMDRIKAEDELKIKTKSSVLHALYEAGSVKEAVYMKERPADQGVFKKRILVGLSTIAACLVLAIGGYGYYSTPVSFISFDINPSIELGINAFNRVVSAEGINEDGEMLLEHFKVANLSPADAAETFVREAASSGYIAGDGSTVIAINAQAASEEKSLQLQTVISGRVETLLDDMDTDAIVFADTGTLEQRKEARKMGISAGKYKMLSYMNTLDPAITIEQYRHRHFPELIEEANQLINQFGSGGMQAREYEQTRRMVMNTAREIEEIRRTEQEQVRQQNRNQSDINEDNEQNQGEDTESKSDPGKYQGDNLKNEGDGKR